MGWIRRIAETMWPHLSEDGWRRQMTYQELMRLGSIDSIKLTATMRQNYPELYRLSQPGYVIGKDIEALVAQGRVKTNSTGTRYEVIA